MAYADKAYYVGDFAGTSLPDADQDTALQMSSDVIDGATMYRIQARGFSNLTDFQQSCVKRACCFIAEDLYAAGALEAGAVLAGGFSLGDLSIQAPAEQKKLGGAPVREIAISLLKASGMMYAGVSFG